MLLSCCSDTTAEVDVERHELQPNIVLIIADDMNWNDCGAYGHPHIRTPHVDALAKLGMRFDNAYLTASSCSPSRASIITGRYPHNTGAEQLHWPLPPGSDTFAEQLKSIGYYTAAAGKWHLGNHVKGHFDMVREASTAGFVLPSGKGNEPARMVAKQPSGCEEWVATIRSLPKDRPYFVWLAALDPHRAYEHDTLRPPHKLSDIIVPKHLPDTPEVREDLRMYYDEIGRLDAYVGKVIDEIKRRNETQNTIVWFISDNGRPFPRDKTTLYDGGIKAPWIVKWPAHIKAGVVSKSLVSSVDIAPTLIEIAAGEVPDSFEGVSIRPIFQNTESIVRRFVFAEDHWHDYEDHARAIFDGRYKLIRNDYADLPGNASC